MRSGLAICLALVSCLPLLSQSQQTKTAPAAPAPDTQDVVRVDVDRVNVLFTVADKKGKFIKSLREPDFKVYEDNVPQVPTNFAAETNLPLNVALLVDTSGSIRDKLRFEQEAAIEFFYSTIRKGQDKAAVISFDSGVDLQQDHTDNPEVLAEAVRKIRAGGGTSLYDAIYLAVNQKLINTEGRRVVILISDGDDNSSRVSLTETLEAAQKHDVVIYAISTNATAYFGNNSQERGDKTLKKLTEETGGRAFFPFKLSDLAVNFQDISEELRAQYTLAYRPTNLKQDGTYRKIRIDVADKKYKVRARTGYYAPKRDSSQ